MKSLPQSSSLHRLLADLRRSWRGCVALVCADPSTGTSYAGAVEPDSRLDIEAVAIAAAELVGVPHYLESRHESRSEVADSFAEAAIESELHAYYFLRSRQRGGIALGAVYRVDEAERPSVALSRLRKALDAVERNDDLEELSSC